ncbi:hypothetical protein J2797_003072 [Paraburkholderia terricola]|uniref:hypothetical protein n=1 Tax=Paraburkholderia terricola TaxID=169427 RepID=UPI002865CECB|nr:hypothetical protein [Paraburkholderia terricola]MDR6493176.1 hypothetical protein [Paraburkholderia terricola]
MSDEEAQEKFARLSLLIRRVDHRVSRTHLNEAISELLNEIDNLENDEQFGLR